MQYRKLTVSKASSLMFGPRIASNHEVRSHMQLTDMEYPVRQLRMRIFSMKLRTTPCPLKSLQHARMSSPWNINFLHNDDTPIRALKYTRRVNFQR